VTFSAASPFFKFSTQSIHCSDGPDFKHSIFPIPESLDAQSITDQPLADGANFAGRQNGLRLPGRSLFAMFFTIFIFKTQLGDDENR
jgi:hypothetical protein